MVSKVYLEKLYQNLGYLFYSIAAAYKVVRHEEIAILRKIIREKWLKLEKTDDKFEKDTTSKIESVFDYLLLNEIVSNNAFTKFEYFELENKKIINKKTKQLIWDTANQIALSFSGNNKSELILLSKLQILLKNN